MYPMHAHYHPDPAVLGFFGHSHMDPRVAYFHHQPNEDMLGFYGLPTAPKSPCESLSPAASHQHQMLEGNQTELVGSVTGDKTPYKYDPSKTPRSPYWGHLDATIAMGLSTPRTHAKEDKVGMMPPEEGAEAASLGNAQPLLLRQSQFYGYGPVNNYGPPSPATQFLMSPQASFGFNYGYGYSPSHGPPPSHFKESPFHGTEVSLSLKQASPGLSPSAAQKKSNKDEEDRESPSTVETIMESESLSEAT